MTRIWKTAGLAAALIGAATGAHAQVAVSGTTSGCFGLNCMNFGTNANYLIGGSGETLQFTGTSFSGMTNPFTNAFTVGNFGTLVLTPAPTAGTPNTTFSTPFTLLFMLSAPAGVNSPSTVFTVSGFVGSGSRDISYSGGSTAFTFGNGAGTISLDGGQVGINATNLSGRVTALGAAAVPELGTWAMMIAGFGAVGATLRRRRSLGARVAFA